MGSSRGAGVTLVQPTPAVLVSACSPPVKSANKDERLSLHCRSDLQAGDVFQPALIGVPRLEQERALLCEVGKQVHTALNDAARRRLAGTLAGLAEDISSALTGTVRDEFTLLTYRLPDHAPTEVELRRAYRDLLDSIDFALIELGAAASNSRVTA